MQIIHPLADSYAHLMSDSPSPAAEFLEAETVRQHPHAHMLSGALQGKLLEMICRMIQPKQVLEIGTFTGYSAICMASGLDADAQLHTIELRAEDAKTATHHFEKAGLSGKVIQHVGDARQIITTLNQTWDLVFIDADKVSYIEYYELTLPKLKPGGWILADNVLFHGQVLEEEVKGKNALAIDAFNRHIKNDSRVEQVLMTIRDGLMLIRKKQ